MRIFVTVKSFGKYKNYLTKEERILHKTCTTLRELLNSLVTENVSAFNEKKVEEPFIKFLIAEEIEEQAKVGKIGFQTKYNENFVNLEEAINTSIIAFQDGLFKVFIDENEQEQLDTPLKIADESEVVFIKLTMLAGRMW